MAGVKLTEFSAQRLETQLLRAEGGAFDNSPKRATRKPRREPTPRVVMMLEDCESGGRAEAAILVEIESTETQLVEIDGSPLSGTFKLQFDEATTATLDYNITAEDLQAALEDLDNINPGDVLVELGPGSESGDDVLYRWLVHFTGQFEGEDVPELVPVEVSIRGQGAFSIVNEEVNVRSQPDVEDTGDTLNALCVVPLPPGMRIYAGNLGVVLSIPTFGYCLIAVECRDCGPYGGPY